MRIGETQDAAARGRWPSAPALAIVRLAACGLLVACGAPEPAPASPWNAPPAGLKGASSGTRAERYFPLVDGNVYLYATTSDAGEQGILVARVHRSGEREGQLRFPSGAKRFQYTDAGVVQADTGAFVLKEPIAAGTTWIGEHGGHTRIVAVNATIDVPAGRFSGCVQTLEERLGDRPVRYVSTFCPDVGVVSIEAASGAGYEKAELKSYAPQVEMGPDGVQRVPLEATPPEPAAPSP